MVDKCNQTVSLGYLVGQAIDAAQAEGSMATPQVIAELIRLGYTKEAKNLKQALEVEIPASVAEQVLDNWIPRAYREATMT